MLRFYLLPRHYRCGQHLRVRGILINFTATTIYINQILIPMEKEKLEGVTLQISAIFARLDALKQALPNDCLDKYNECICQKAEQWKNECDVNLEQLAKWLQ